MSTQRTFPLTTQHSRNQQAYSYKRPKPPLRLRLTRSAVETAAIVLGGLVDLSEALHNRRQAHRSQ